MVDTSLAGKCIIVTGAGHGLGRAMSLGMVQRGAFVIAVDIVADSVRTLRDEARGVAGSDCVLPLVEDISNEAGCNAVLRQTLKAERSISGLINNAGRGMTAIRNDYLQNPPRFWEVETDRWQAVMDLNVRGPFLLARLVAPHLIRAGWGRIVNVTTSFDTMYRAAYTPYGPSKAAMEAATASWAKDLEGTGVTCNALIPGGAVNTGFFAPDAPLDRASLIQPDIMVAPICWLMSDASEGYTGMRYVAREWDTSLPPVEAAKKIGAPAAWPSLGGQSLWPGGKPVR